jgi:hypothetical protein
MPDDGKQVEGGIFTPWDKILERIERQYEQILLKLDAKVDMSTFTQFVSNYETRHERLVQSAIETTKFTDERLKTIEAEGQGQKAISDRYVPEFLDIKVKVAELEDERLTRDAVKNDRRILYYGGGLLSLLVLMNLVINILQGASGALP